MAAFWLLSLIVFQKAAAQCQGGTPYSVLEYTQTMNLSGGNNSTGDFRQFQFPEFPVSTGTLASVNFRSSITLPDYSYTIENQNPDDGGNFRVRIQKMDDVTSPSFPDGFELFGTRISTHPQFFLAASDGVPNSGPDYRFEENLSVWNNTTIFNQTVYDEVANFMGNGMIDFNYNMEISQVLTVPFSSIVTFSGDITTVFRMTYQYCPASILSDDFLTFSAAKLNESRYSLVWAVNEEKPGTRYMIMTSKDGKNFTQLDIINGTHSADANKKYSYAGNKLNGVSGLQYFRIVKMEPDGVKKHSNIESVEWQAGYSSSLNIYPNPVRNETKISIPGTTEKKWLIEIFGADGKQFFKEQKTLLNGAASLMLPASVSKGMYILKATPVSGGTPVTTKLFVDR